MKKLLVLFAVLLSGFSARAGGWEGGNAGDAYAAEFIFTGRDLLQRLELLAAAGLPVIPTAQLRETMQTTQVVTEDLVTVGGLERDAATDRDKKTIHLNRRRWTNLRRSDETKARLRVVLHEYFWAIGVDDTNYVKSEPVIEALNVPNYSPSIWVNTPGLAFAVAECAGRLADGGFVTVRLHTKGAAKSPDHGEVSIERGGNTFGYRFKAEEVAQFFEFDDMAANTATVGLNAYVKREFPVLVKYVGTNYADMDLKAVIMARGQDPQAAKAGNFMHIWKGPGYQVSDQYHIDTPACSVSSNN